jgi:tetratricopeptide (TPR) repeat protein
MTRSVLTLLIVLTPYFSSAPAFAEESNAGSEAAAETLDEEARSQARVQFFTGMELVQQERWEEALAAFDSSLELFPTQAALFNRGLCLGLMGRPVEAVATLEQHLEEYGASISEEQRTASERALGTNSARVAHVVVSVTDGDGGAIALDGTAIGTAPLSEAIPVNPGRHQVTAQLEGFLLSSEWVEVSAGDSASVTLTLEEVPEPTEILIPTPVEDPSARGRGLRVGGWVTTSLAVAALGTAVALVVWNGSRFDDWDQEDQALRLAYSQTETAPQNANTLADRVADNDELGSSIQTMDIVGSVLLGVGAAVAATGVVLLVLGYRARNEAEVTIAPSLNGLTLSGRW